MANVKFKAYMNFTSVDPGEVVRFVKRQYPDVVRVPPRISIYDMAKKKGILPSAKVRWCCAEYKEIGGVGKVTLVGVRREESIRRSKRNEITSSNFKISETFDQFSKHEEEMVACVRGRDKIIISPILHWTERNVWEFLNEVVKVPHCELYDQGHTRIGCILCPMASYKNKLKDIERWSYVKKKWMETIDWLIKNKWTNTTYKSLSAQERFDMWISRMTYKQWMNEKHYQKRLFETDEDNEDLPCVNSDGRS
jgi:phosphoadenosine phosphosulfate reductase